MGWTTSKRLVSRSFGAKPPCQDFYNQSVLTFSRVRVWLWHRATLVEDGDVGLSEDLENLGDGGSVAVSVSPAMLFIDLVTKLLVGLVDVALGEDVEGGAHQSEESRVEVDRPVRVQGHVHRDQALQARDYDLYLGCDWLPCKPHDEDRAFQNQAEARFSWKGKRWNSEHVDAVAYLRRVTTSTCLMNPLASGSYSLQR